MADIVSASVRSKIMSLVPQRDTKPERFVRQLLHAMGYRFRLHRRSLPGSPDIVLPKFRTAIYVHGCFWHQHEDCRRSRRPSSNCGYWEKKLSDNIDRDRRDMAALESAGWKPVVVWECETRDPAALGERLRREIGGPTAEKRP